MRKTPNRSAGEPLSNVQHRRTGREEPEPGRPARPRCQTPPRGPGRVPRRRPRSRQMKQHPRNRSEKTPARPAAALRQIPQGVRPRPNPAGDRTHRTGPGLWAAAPGEKGSAPSDVSGNVRADHCDRPCSPAFPPPRITLFLLFPNNLTGAWFSLTYGCLHRRAGALLSQCTYRCVVLPDLSSRTATSTSLASLNAPTGAWCSLTTSEGTLWDRSSGLNAPTGAWCSLTSRKEHSCRTTLRVSMHLQVRGAP